MPDHEYATLSSAVLVSLFACGPAVQEPGSELGGWEVSVLARWREPGDEAYCPVGPSGGFAIFRP